MHLSALSRGEVGRLWRRLRWHNHSDKVGGSATLPVLSAGTVPWSLLFQRLVVMA
jgi:hypothetical protein